MEGENTRIANLGRLGKTLEKKLAGIGIKTVSDLLFYFPRRFDDFSAVVPIGDLRPQMSVTIHGRIEMIRNRRSRHSRMNVTEGLVSDESGSVHVVWFNQAFLTKNLHVGDMVSLSGKTNDHYYDLQMVSPSYEKADISSLHTGRLVPVYSLSAGVTQKQLRTLMRAGLDTCLSAVHEWLPREILAEESFPEMRPALEAIHFPTSVQEWEAARARFQFEELFLLQLFNVHLKKTLSHQPSPSVPFDDHATKKFISRLPFVLTPEQRTTAWEILQDIKKPYPMNRLLQGDVGSGKTVVACLAMLNAVRAGYQCAIMAPTEILAMQHYKTLTALFKDFDVRIALLTSGNQESRIKNQELCVAIAGGTIDIVVGTHALIQEKIQFNHCAIAIIDEQHRFGVKQRKALREKNSEHLMPHLLSLTATPIPRSLALTVYGDLDISTIRTLPKGRKKIITKIVPQNFRQWTYEFIQKNIKRGRQAFVICPIINQSDALGVRSATEEYEKLTHGPFRQERVGMLHGKMKAGEKERVMTAFCNREIDILVTTSVVEVGIDVPNANVVLIEGAERFGLAQLHQLRGRVGRASNHSYCFLAPTDESKEEIARLQAVVSSHDGFVLAQKDLELRGEGDVLGSRQSGIPRLKIASLFDTELIKKAHAYADRIYPNLQRYPELAARIESFGRVVHLE